VKVLAPKQFVVSVIPSTEFSGCWIRVHCEPHHPLEPVIAYKIANPALQKAYEDAAEHIERAVNELVAWYEED
jgi:hypothetical protein